MGLVLLLFALKFGWVGYRLLNRFCGCLHYFMGMGHWSSQYLEDLGGSVESLASLKSEFFLSFEAVAFWTIALSFA